MGAVDHLVLVRLVVLTIWALIIVLTPYEAYAALPPEMIRGFGLGQAVLASAVIKQVIFSPSVLGVLRWSGIGCCLLSAFWPRRPVLIVTLGNVLLLDLVTKSISGYPNHAQFSALSVLFVVAVFAGPSRAGRSKHSLAEEQDTHAATLWLAGVLLVVPYTYIGINRLLVGGMELFVSDALPQYVGYTAQFYSAYGLGVPLPWLQEGWFVTLMKVGFGITTLCEICSIGVLLSARFRAGWLLVMTGFHITTLLAMNIFFWENLILIWVLFGWGLRKALRRERWGGRWPDVTGQPAE